MTDPQDEHTGFGKCPVCRTNNCLLTGLVSPKKPASKGSYDQGYKDGWDAAILQVVKKQLDNF